MPFGILLLIGAGVLIYLGLAHRVLDRLYLTDRAALFIILGLLVFSFIDIPLGPNLIINVGGAILPIGLVLYILYRCDTKEERVKGLIGGAVTGAAIWGAAILLSRFGHGHHDILAPTFIFAILAAVVAYALGRSRRNAFVSAVLGFILYDGLIMIQGLGITGATEVHLGGAGIFDTTILAALLALGLVEVFGETVERVEFQMYGEKNGEGRKGHDDEES